MNYNDKIFYCRILDNAISSLEGYEGKDEYAVSSGIYGVANLISNSHTDLKNRILEISDDLEGAMPISNSEAVKKLKILRSQYLGNTMETLVLASHNKGKLKEFEGLLQGLVGEVKSAADLRLIEPAETGTTFLENAKIKALAAMHVSGLPALSDDSGLSVNALGGEPGVYSADWAGHPRDFQKAMALVHEKMGDAKDRSAYFTSMLVLAYPDGRIEHFEGRVDGKLVWPPRGVEGFGYDPMFMPDGYDKTFGEMTNEEKQSISHRAKAVEKFIEYLKSNI